ncbi:MAG: hypothetical protein ACYCZO_05985 [Daejeonella sp.]
MRDTIYFYLTICLVAIALKYLSILVLKLFTQDHSPTHEKEHELGTYIKILILVLLGFAIWYLASSDTYLLARSCSERTGWNF